MRPRGWFFRPPRWWIGSTALLGAVVFVVVSLLSSPFINTAGVRTNYEMLWHTLVFSACMLVLPLTRWYGLGFFAAMLIGSVDNTFRFREWWVPVNDRINMAMRPRREKRARQDSTAAWFARHRGKELDVSDAAWLLGRVREDCLRGPVAANLDELLSNPRCAPHRTTTQPEKLEWPARYALGDDGWRWGFERVIDSTAADIPNYRIVVRPDSALKQPGPIVEEMADGLARVRKDEGSDWHVVSTPIPTLRRVRECVLLATAMADAEQNKTVIIDYLYEGYYAEHVCRDIRMSSSTIRENGDHVVEIKQRTLTPDKRLSSEVVLFRTLGPRRFEVRKETVTRHYLLDADGSLHVTSENRQAETKDPAPSRCEEDTALPCT